MSAKHSRALVKRWAKVPKDKRSAAASHAAKSRMQALSPKQRRKIGTDLVKARKAKE